MTSTLKDFLSGELELLGGAVVLVKANQSTLGKFRDSKGEEYTILGINSDYSWTKSGDITTSTKANVVYSGDSNTSGTIDVHLHYGDLLVHN